ncbi:MAG: hypothetical protein IID39_08320 [Planctomycetes bacterium]|nr:hypothetical protein [Planctomycetota bacterium]
MTNFSPILGIVALPLKKCISLLNDRPDVTTDGEGFTTTIDARAGSAGIAVVTSGDIIARQRNIDPLRLWQRMEPRTLQDPHRRFVGSEFNEVQVCQGGSNDNDP